MITALVISNQFLLAASFSNAVDVVGSLIAILRMLYL